MFPSGAVPSPRRVKDRVRPRDVVKLLRAWLASEVKTDMLMVGFLG